MVRLLLAEIHYNLTLILSYHVLILMISIYEISSGSEQSAIMVLMMHLVLFFILQNRINEKLARMQLLLPISAIKVGLVRVLLLFIPVMSILLLYFLIHSQDASQMSADFVKLIFLGGIFLAIYFLFCLGRDFYFSYGQQRLIKYILVSFTALSMGIGVIISIGYLIAKLNIWDRFNALLEEFLIVILILLLIVLAVMTIYTFSLRKSYL